MIHWENPTFLLALWILPLVAGVLIYAYRKRRRAAERFADPEMLQRLMPSPWSWRPWAKGTATVLALGLLILAAAGPRFGMYFQKVTQRGADVFVALDVSRSMTAEDVAPSRLERAKSDIRDLLARVVGDRVGLIVFAGKPAMKVPLTTDHGFFLSALDDVDVGSAPRGGTMIGDAIRKCIASMPPRQDRDQAIILITDGEDQDSYAVKAAEHAAEQGIKIFAVGLGDAREGARIPIRNDSGGLTYLKDEGKEHWSKVNEALLNQIAMTTHGAYIPAGTRVYDLGQIYKDHLEQLARGEFRAEKRTRYHEQFQWFVSFAAVLLLIELAIPSYRRNGVAGVKRSAAPVSARTGASPTNADHRSAAVPGRCPSATSHPRRNGTETAKASVIVGGVMFLSLWITPGSVSATEASAPTKVRQGIELFQSGDYKKAAAAFAEAEKAAPSETRVTFDMACAKAAEKDFDKAIELYQRVAQSPDPRLAVYARYNLGQVATDKAKALFGQRPEEATPEIRQQGTDLLMQAVAHFRDCIEMDPSAADARHNLEVIRVWLKHMDSLWRERDRQKLRDSMNLVQFLEWLDGQQRTLRATSKTLDSVPDSPKRRQVVYMTASEQRDLAKEIAPLKEKIVAALQQPAQPPGTTAAAPPQGDMQKAAELLSRLADTASRAMTRAADQLDAQNPFDAHKSQTNAIENLDQIYMAAAPYPGLLMRALGKQQGLVEAVQSSLHPAQENPAAKHAPKAALDKSTPEEDTSASAGQLDASETGWDQRFVERWAQVMIAKAQQGLKQLPKASSPDGPASGTVAPGAPAPAAPAPGAAATGRGSPQGPPDDKAAAAEAAKKQQEGLRKSMEKAVELGPQVVDLTGQAAADLDHQNPPNALPKQKKALELLKEIAKPLQQNQDKKNQQQNQQNQKQNQDQKKQDNKNQSKKNQDKNKQDQKKQEQNKDQQQKQQQSQKEKDKQKKDSQEQKAQSQPRDLSKEQAKALMRRVEARQKEDKQAKKEIEAILAPAEVQKDW